MNFDSVRSYSSHGSGAFNLADFGSIGENVIIEDGVKVFHPVRIRLGNNVYIGHNAILKGHHLGSMQIGDHSWIGQGCFLHSAGNIEVGTAVGIGPNVTILTSVHREGSPDQPVLVGELDLGEVVLGDGCDIGVGAIILPGITVGEGSIIGAGSVVTRDIDPYSVVAGNPARLLRTRAIGRSEPR